MRVVSREPPPFFHLNKTGKMREPDNDAQKTLNDLLEERADYVELGGRRISIGWIKKGVVRKLTDTILNCDKEDELSAKCASLVILNGYWKIKFFHRIYWRYLWRKYSDEELFAVLTLAKKKVDLQAQAYLTNTIYLIGMKDTVMSMTREEAECTLRELRQERLSPTGKSTRN